MGRRTLVLLLLAVSARADEGELRKRIAVVAEKLAAIEVPVDLDRVKVVLNREAYPAALEDKSEGYRVLQELLGTTRYPTPRPVAAYYDPAKREFVLRTWRWDDDLIAHELCHAHQHQRGVSFDKAPPTTELRWIRDHLVEGEAETVVLRLRLKDAGQTLADVDRTALGLMRRAGLVGLDYMPYIVGKRAVIETAVAKGWKDVHALYADESLSMEQILHPEKLGRDRPTRVEIPMLKGASRIHADSWGELGIYLRLSTLGARTAAVAALGWDGDSIGVFRMADGAHVAIWMTVWDRNVDAEQFAHALRRTTLGIVHVRGRYAVWLSSLPSVAADPWEQFILSGLKKLPPAPDDAASTARAELEWPVPREWPRDQRWHIDALGLSVPIPGGWRVREDLGGSYIGDDRNLCGIAVMVEPRVGKDPFAAVEKECERGARAWATKISAKRIVVSGLPALRIDEADWRSELLILKGSAIFRIAASGRAEELAEARRALDGIELTAAR